MVDWREPPAARPRTEANNDFDDVEVYYNRERLPARSTINSCGLWTLRTN
jgi:hypothetical protein